MSNDCNPIVLFQQPNDPSGTPPQGGLMWINEETGAFFTARNALQGDGNKKLEWHKESQIQPDWLETNAGSSAFIKNKPAIPGREEFNADLDDASPLATEAELTAGTDETRHGITPKVFKDSVEELTRSISEDAQSNKEALDSLAGDVEENKNALDHTLGNDSNIQDLANVPALVANRIARVNPAGNGIEWVNNDWLIPAPTIQPGSNPRTGYLARFLTGERRNVMAFLDLEDSPERAVIQLDLNEVVFGGLYIVQVSSHPTRIDKYRVTASLSGGSSLLPHAHNTFEDSSGHALDHKNSLLTFFVSIIGTPSNPQVDVYTTAALKGLGQLGDFLNDLDEETILADTDYFPVVHPVTEGRSSAKDVRSASNPNNLGVTLANNDFGYAYPISGNEDRTVYRALTLNLANAYSNELLQISSRNAGADVVAKTDQAIILMNDVNALPQGTFGGLLIDPNEGKIVLLINHDTIGTINLKCYHPSTGVTIVDSAAAYRNNIGSYKARGAMDYVRLGGYVWTLTAGQIPEVFPTVTDGKRVPAGGRLHFISAPSFTSGQWQQRLNIELAKELITQVVAGKEIRRASTQTVSKKVGEATDRKIEQATSNIRSDIDQINETLKGLGGGDSGAFHMQLLGASVNFQTAEAMPAVGANFDLSLYVQNGANAPAGNIRVTMNGFNLNVVTQPDLTNPVSLIEVNIPDQTARQNLIRSVARDGRVEFQVFKGNSDTDILHIPLVNQTVKYKHRAIRLAEKADSADLTAAEIATALRAATYNNLTVGRTYRIKIQPEVLTHDVARQALRVSAEITASQGLAPFGNSAHIDMRAFGNQGDEQVRELPAVINIFRATARNITFGCRATENIRSMLIYITLEELTNYQETSDWD